MRTCENCKYSEPMVGALACMGQKGMPYVRPTDSCDRWKTMKQTNHDRIVSMKPEELAMAICTDFGGIPWCKNIPECQDTLCVGCVVKWLKQEAE